MLAALKTFKAERGHCRVPQRFQENSRLADWVSRIRTFRNRGTLPSDQEKILTELGFDWNPVRNKWDYMFDQLVEYKKRVRPHERPAAFRQIPRAGALGAQSACGQAV